MSSDISVDVNIFLKILVLFAKKLAQVGFGIANVAFGPWNDPLVSLDERGRGGVLSRAPSIHPVQSQYLIKTAWGGNERLVSLFAVAKLHLRVGPSLLCRT
jgi:hypothetical protein